MNKEEIRRHSDENIKEFQYRVCRNKDVGVYKITWDDVAEIMNKETGNNWGESKYRKWYYAFNDGVEYSAKQNTESEEIIEDIERAKEELYMQEIRTRDKLRELRTSWRTDARIENLKNIAIESARIISHEKPIIIKKNQIESSNRIGILQISDFHFNEIVDDYFNTYNKEVFNSRIEKLVNKTIEYAKANKVNVLKVLNLNDLISGNIHVSVRVMNEEDAISQIMYISEVLCNMMKRFADEFDLVESHHVLDNHSRINKNKKEHIEKESFARIIPWFMKERLKDVSNFKLIENIIDENIGTVDIFGETAFFVHGHLDKISNAVQNLTLMTRIFPIAVFIGHYHHSVEDEVHGIPIIANPSLIGTNEYAKNIRRTSKPAQKLSIFDKEDGRIATYVINLEI